MREHGVGWKGTLCFECKKPVDQDADFGHWFHVDDVNMLDDDHEITPCIPNGPPDEDERLGA